MRSPRFLPPPGAASPKAPVLCLAATLQPGQASDLSGAVLARLAESGYGAETVVLALDGDIDADRLKAVCSLHECLRAHGTRLRLVIEANEAAGQPQAPAASEAAAPLMIHPSLRSAVLAAYAALPGPGLVDAQVRTALSVPAERVHLPARIVGGEGAARPEVVYGPG